MSIELISFITLATAEGFFPWTRALLLKRVSQLVFMRSTEFYSSMIQVMEIQGISVDSQVLIDASNTLKVNDFFSTFNRTIRYYESQLF